MCSREWARRLRRFSRSMARYTMRENRWYTRPLRRKERAVAWPLPRSFWEKAMLLSPLLVPVNCRNWRGGEEPGMVGTGEWKRSLASGWWRGVMVGGAGARRVDI